MLQIQGIEGKAVVVYREPSITPEMQVELAKSRQRRDILGFPEG